jgi:hypothetical protein
MGNNNIILTALWCLILFHSSDGSLIWIKSAAITVVKPILSHHRDHIAKGTAAVVYTTAGRTFGVHDDATDIVSKVDSCDR